MNPMMPLASHPILIGILISIRIARHERPNSRQLLAPCPLTLSPSHPNTTLDVVLESLMKRNRRSSAGIIT